MNTESANLSTTPVNTPRWQRLLPVLIIAVAVLAPLAVGILTPEPMIGDEVTHFYMLTTQAEKLPAGNVEAEIPLAYGGVHKRNYPHVFLWHYLGAIVWKVTGGISAAVQIYHTLYWLQFLIAAWFLARAEAPGKRDAALVFVLTVASVPMNLLFSVVFYQDIPAAAQVLSAFATLRMGHWLLSVAFMALAISLKVSAMTLIPVYLLVMAWFARPDGWRLTVLRPLVAGAMLVAACVPSAISLQRLGWAYYPALQLEFALKRLGIDWRPGSGQRSVSGDNTNGTAEARSRKKKFRAPVDLAKAEASHHPGDLRNPVNLVVYGGVLALGVFGAGLAFLAGAVGRRRCDSSASPANTGNTSSRTTPGSGAVQETGPPPGSTQTSRHVSPPTGGAWAMVAGVAATALTLWQVRQAPDIRFILPALPLVLLPGAVAIGAFSARFRWILPLIAVAATLQAGAVLAKTKHLRAISPGIREVIAFLSTHRPDPPTVFMYPEGHYRLFPVPHDWYLGSRLKELWEADNTARLTIFSERKIGGIVVKKDRIGKLDNGGMNLGIYPDTFLRDIRDDPRFRKVFENGDAIVYAIAETEKTAVPGR